MKFSLLLGLWLAIGESCYATTTTTKHTSTTSTKTTKSTSTTTTTYLGGPSVSSCGGPQLYNLTVHRTDNNKYLGNVLAEVGDGGIFGIEIYPYPPDAGQYYVTQFYRSYAAADYGDFIAYTLPDPSVGVSGTDIYYLRIAFLGDTDPGDTQGVVISPRGDPKFQCSVAKSTGLLDCTVPPKYGNNYTFVAEPEDPSDPKSFYTLYYALKGVAVKNQFPIQIAAKKSC